MAEIGNTFTVVMSIDEPQGVRMFLARFFIQLAGLLLGCQTDIEWPISSVITPDVVDNEDIT